MNPSTIRSDASPAGFVLLVHGGAGSLPASGLDTDRQAALHAGLRAALEAGAAVLASGGPALDAVVAAVCSLEDCPLFNAGRGAVLNREGDAELDAAVMEGTTRRAGAVAAVRRIRNPVEAAHAVLRHSPHLLLAGDGADRFARDHGVATAPPDHFRTAERIRQLEETLRPPARTPAGSRTGTVGAVACDRTGRLAAATSTGGTVAKHPGRVGDSPLIGAGTYADDRTCAVSATGHGESFIRCVAAHAVSARIRHLGEDIDTAARAVIVGDLGELGGAGGLIAVDAAGRIALPFNTARMYRGWLREGAAPQTALFPG